TDRPGRTIACQQTDREPGSSRRLPAWSGRDIENTEHPRQLAQCAEILQGSGAVGPEVRPQLGVAFLCRRRWLCYAQAATNTRPAGRGTTGRRNCSRAATQSRRSPLGQGVLPLWLSEGL